MWTLSSFVFPINRWTLNSGQNRVTLVYDSPLQCYGALNFVHFSIFVYFRPILLLINTLFLIFVQLMPSASTCRLQCWLCAVLLARLLIVLFIVQCQHHMGVARIGPGVLLGPTSSAEFSSSVSLNYKKIYTAVTIDEYACNRDRPSDVHHTVEGSAVADKPAWRATLRRTCCEQIGGRSVW